MNVLAIDPTTSQAPAARQLQATITVAIVVYARDRRFVAHGAMPRQILP